jgi:hypothetical protein
VAATPGRKPSPSKQKHAKGTQGRGGKKGSAGHGKAKHGGGGKHPHRDACSAKQLSAKQRAVCRKHRGDR